MNMSNVHACTLRGNERHLRKKDKRNNHSLKAQGTGRRQRKNISVFFFFWMRIMTTFENLSSLISHVEFRQIVWQIGIPIL